MDSLQSIFELIKSDKYSTEDARRFYKPGEISQTTGLQKQPDGSWAEPRGKQSQSKPRVLSAEMRIKIRPGTKDPGKIKTATSLQKKSLEKISTKVEVSKIDSNAIKTVDKTVKSLIKDYNMRPLEYIDTFNKAGGAMGQTDGDGISLNEDFFNNPEKYYNNMIEAQNYAVNKYEEAKHKTPLKGMEELYEKTLSELVQYTVRSNALYKGREVESVILHEMGHVLSNQRVCMLHGKQTEEMMQINQYVKDTFEKAKETGEINLISQYARKDHTEFFAEAFVVYKMGIDKLPAYITDMIARVIG
jgi:hypothetical protein